MKPKILVTLANMAWFIASLPEWLVFFLGSQTLKSTQVRLLRSIIRENRKTRFGRAHRFSRKITPQSFSCLPLTDYEDYQELIDDMRKGGEGLLTWEKVLLLEPTGGSSGGTKLIPYTGSLQKQFRKAIDVWIAGTFLFRPSLLFGRHYWSISPNTRCDEAVDTGNTSSRYDKTGDPGNTSGRSLKQIGFAEDTEYLGLSQKWLAGILLAVPPEVRYIEDRPSFEYVTLLFLVREKNLRLISIWNPTFLMILMDRLKLLFDQLIHDIQHGSIKADLTMADTLKAKLEGRIRPDPQRARELSGIDLHEDGALVKVWPQLKVISCWTDGNSSIPAQRLGRYFPGVEIDGKGLVATEGIVSIPLGKKRKKALAYRSHFFEFIDVQSGLIKRAWELEKEKVYSIILTTGGGLYRYRLNDLIWITGFMSKVPCLDFISKEDMISDVVGEKINEAQVAGIFKLLEEKLGFFPPFRLLAPVTDGQDFHYSLFIEPPPGCSYDYHQVLSIFEDELSRNYHYRHARNVSQLKALRLFVIKEGTGNQMYFDYLMRKGQKSGDIKMSFLRPDLTWDKIFIGQYFND